MKKIYYILISIFLVSCYTDEDEIITAENTAHNTSELTAMVMSVSMHEASFDNRIDNTSCFSLVFPYQIYINQELQTISSEDDISIAEEDDIAIVFPVNVISYNYDEHQALSSSELNSIKMLCEIDFDLMQNPCLNLQYPINIKEYNEFTENFESLQFQNDKDMFQYLDNLHDTDFYEIDYPLFIEDSDSNTIRIDSNSEFEQTYNSYFNDCE